MKKSSKIIAKSVARTSKSVVKNINPLDVVREYVDYRKCIEQQKTESKRIKAERDRAVKAIETEKEVILAYFDMRFKERKQALKHLFKTLDKGIVSKDNEIIDKALCGIVVIIKDNPLKDFQSFRRQRLEGEIIEI